MAAADDELVFKSAEELGPLLQGREISPVEVTEAFLARAESLNPRLNAFITITRDPALARAREAEREIRGGNYRGPLHGVPYAPKDILATRGIRTTNGSKLTADWIPDFESTITERLNQAGAILIGKLNLLEFAMGSGVVSGFGPAKNPWTSITRPPARPVDRARRWRHIWFPSPSAPTPGDPSAARPRPVGSWD
jgi:aspartyl-tRNA(Asn)/glutamyl-tRNA(Gln) amidotransferase subunit A